MLRNYFLDFVLLIPMLVLAVMAFFTHLAYSHGTDVQTWTAIIVSLSVFVFGSSLALILAKIAHDQKLAAQSPETKPY